MDTDVRVKSSVHAKEAIELSRVHVFLLEIPEAERINMSHNELRYLPLAEAILINQIDLCVT